MNVNGNDAAAVKTFPSDLKFQWQEIVVQEPPTGICWSPGGEKLITWAKTGLVTILTTRGDSPLAWQGHNSQALQASWSCDGRLVATSGRDGNCKVWTTSGDCVASLRHPEGWVEHLKWSPRTEILATACSNKLRLWSMSGALVDEFDGHKWPITDLIWHPIQRDLFASCAADGVTTWGLGSHEPLHRLAAKGYPQQLSFNRTGSILAYACSDCSVHVWNLGSGIVLKLQGESGELHGLQWSWGGQWLAFCGDYEAYLWKFNADAPQSTRPAQLTGSSGRITVLRFHDYEHLMACGDEDGFVYVWRTDRQERTTPVAAYRAASAVTDLAWNPMTKQLAIAESSGKISLWSSEFKPSYDARKTLPV